MTYLLDTNIISELRKRAPSDKVLSWYRSATSAELFISVLTIGEIRMGIERLRRRDINQAADLESWLDGLLSAYQDRIVAVGTEAAQEWGRFNVPDQLPIIDGLLAATAKVHDWTLVSRNTKDLQRSGVKLLNPFD